ncbi:MAG: tetraacyldisaccharide 4'-kinase [Saprospiraceae bacterium]|nr:tetraacyldisaccharide 4'-kinase [Saprospiraceae bacterium]
MLQEWLVKILLSPFSLLYGIAVGMRNFFYRVGLLKSVHFSVPVISVGNLSVGGSGKTPHIEYLLRLLKDYIDVATLSRGYRRKTIGFLEVKTEMSAEDTGDEPMQFKRKYPDVVVTVGENRAFAIPRILSRAPDTELILLDDAFQHRAVKPGLNILLTEFSKPFTRDYLLPSGRLRDWRASYERADIIVSKCPTELTDEQRQSLTREIEPFPHQRLFFSYYQYGTPYHAFNPSLTAHLQPDMEVLLICAIANTDYLMAYLSEKVATAHVLEYEDHHYFDSDDIQNLQRTFNTLNAPRKIILTTEKDAVRLESHRDFFADTAMPIFALPIEVAFHDDDGPRFDQDIKNFLLNFKT